MYNASLLRRHDDVEHKEHSYRISRYPVARRGDRVQLT
ncbi:hypothetical protein HBB16_16980 [Pseudonocardia sp. MCCB 268]|nr:hypothetical protein [Pseudonocardia cytotoxica]